MHRDEQKKTSSFGIKQTLNTTQKQNSQNFEILLYISRITKCSLAGPYSGQLSIHSHEKREVTFVMCWAIHKNLVSLTELGQSYTKQSLDPFAKQIN